MSGFTLSISEDKLIVAPGVAVDATGQMLRTETPLELSHRELAEGAWMVVLGAREMGEESTRVGYQGVQGSHVHDECFVAVFVSVIQSRNPPPEGTIALGSLSVRSDGTAVIVRAFRQTQSLSGLRQELQEQIADINGVQEKILGRCVELERRCDGLQTSIGELGSRVERLHTDLLQEIKKEVDRALQRLESVAREVARGVAASLFEEERSRDEEARKSERLRLQAAARLVASPITSALGQIEEVASEVGHLLSPESCAAVISFCCISRLRLEGAVHAGRQIDGEEAFQLLTGFRRIEQLVIDWVRRNKSFLMGESYYRVFLDTVSAADSSIVGGFNEFVGGQPLSDKVAVWSERKKSGWVRLREVLGQGMGALPLDRLADQIELFGTKWVCRDTLVLAVSHSRRDHRFEVTHVGGEGDWTPIEAALGARLSQRDLSREETDLIRQALDTDSRARYWRCRMSWSFGNLTPESDVVIVKSTVRASGLDDSALLTVRGTSVEPKKWTLADRNVEGAEVACWYVSLPASAVTRGADGRGSIDLMHDSSDGGEKRLAYLVGRVYCFQRSERPKSA